MYSRLWELLTALRNMPRVGWLQRGVQRAVAESILEHCSAVAAIALHLALLAKNMGIEVDVYRTVTIAVLHDFPEAVVTDIPPTLKKLLPPGTKEKVDAAGAEEISKLFKGAENEVKQLLQEFIRCETTEAKIAKIADYIATALTAQNYKQQGYTKVEEILQNCIHKALETIAKDPKLKPLEKHIKTLLNQELNR